MPLTREKFTELVLAELDAVDRLARSLTRPPESDDLVQETCVRALRSWESFKLESYGIRPWLFTILHNVYRTRLRRESKQPKPTDAEVLNALPHAGEDSIPEQFDTDISKDTDLGAALAAIDPDLRTILMLWGVDELSYREIAQVLDIPMGTVMSRLHRARKKLIEKLPTKTAARNEFAPRE